MVKFVVSGVSVDDNIVLIITLSERLYQTNHSPQTICNSFTHTYTNHKLWPVHFLLQVSATESLFSYSNRHCIRVVVTAVVKVKRIMCKWNHLLFNLRYQLSGWQTADPFPMRGHALCEQFAFFSLRGLTIFGHLVNIIKENKSTSDTWQ